LFLLNVSVAMRCHNGYSEQHRIGKEILQKGARNAANRSKKNAYQAKQMVKLR